MILLLNRPVSGLFKIDLIVWKLDLLDAHKDETFEFKIDLIVWKYCKDNAIKEDEEFV